MVTFYISNVNVWLTTYDNHASWDSVVILDKCRGSITTYDNCRNKDFAIAYDRFICLVDGEYEIHAKTQQMVAGGTYAPIYINGVQMGYNHLEGSTTNNSQSGTYKFKLKRGDQVQVKGRWGAEVKYNNLTITRM